MAPGVDSEALAERVEKAMRRRKAIVSVVFFVLSLFLFVLFMIIAWGMALSDTYFVEQIGLDNAPVPGALFMLTMGWFTALLFQFINILMQSGVGDRQMRGQIASELLGEQLLQQALANAGEKPKRDSSERLSSSDDGEVVELTEDGELVAVERRSAFGGSA